MKLLLLGLLCAAVAAAAIDVAEIETNDVAKTETSELDLFSAPAPVNDDLEIAKRSLEAVRDFIEIFNSDIFNAVTKNIKKVAEIVSKVFSFVISIINLIQGIGQQESAEMKFMREQFAEVHAKLDSISLKLDDVKKLIEWRSTRSIYAHNENVILSMSTLLNDYVTATKDERESNKNAFITAFKANSLAALNLYNAIVLANYVVTDNLAAAVVHYTNNHRRHVMNFLLDMQRLIMRGAQLEIAYEKITAGDNAAKARTQVWDARMEKLLTKMMQVEDVVKDKFHSTFVTDIDRFILDFRQLSHHDFSGRMYHFLADKYDWRRWFSLAYNDVTGWHVHTLSPCTGYTVIRFRTHGSRNVVVSSIDPQTSHFSKGQGLRALAHAQSVGAGVNAVDWTNLIHSQALDCSAVVLVGSVCAGCGAWFTVRNDHWAYRVMPNGGNMHTFVFG